MKKIVKLDFSAFSKYFYWQAISNSSGATKPKFSRRFVKPVRLYLYGLIAKLFAKPVISNTSCDVLLLHRSKKGSKLGLRDHLISKLRDQGLNVIEAYTEKNKNILKAKLFSPPPFKIPLISLFYASYASYLIEQYKPKVIMTDSNGSVLAPFLKAFLVDKGKLVHVAHCVVTDTYRHYSMIEFDYYFLYGRSSFDRLKKRDVLFGNCKCVLTGSYLGHSSISIPAIKANKTLLFFCVGPNIEKHALITDMHTVINDWISSHPDYELIIKPHPRSDLDYWYKQEKKLKNLQVLAKGISMPDALKDVSITLSIDTNAVVDAALLNRPSLLVANSKARDEHNIEKFFLSRSETVEELMHHIKTMLENYPHHVQQAKTFAKYHLEHQHDSVDYITDCIDKIVHDKEDFPVETLQGQRFILN